MIKGVSISNEVSTINLSVVVVLAHQNRRSRAFTVPERELPTRRELPEEKIGKQSELR